MKKNYVSIFLDLVKLYKSTSNSTGSKLANEVLMPYSLAEPQIREGDVLLFRGQGFISRILQKAGRGLYSHVGLASWSGDILELIEMREIRNGRTVSLKNIVFDSKGKTSIDVYRPQSPVTVFVPNPIDPFNYDKRSVPFDGRAITNCARMLTGKQYGWSRIVMLAKLHAPILRWLNGKKHENFDDTVDVTGSYVCSTLVAHCYRAHFVDLVTNRSDATVEPSGISRSPVLKYICTLEAEEE